MSSSSRNVHSMTLSLINQARAFAENAHDDIDHLRKYSGDPYTVHLEAVATLVKDVSGTPEMIAAAWLHDAVEDTLATIESIEAEFGREVAALVSDLTDVSNLDDGNRMTRKAIDLTHIANASPAAKTVKLADLIDNARSIVVHDPGFAKVYMREMRTLLEVLKEGDDGLYEKAESIVRDYYAD